MRGRLVTELKLVARQEVGAQAGSGGEPTRYVEFDLSAPLRVPAIKGAR